MSNSGYAPANPFCPKERYARKCPLLLPYATYCLPTLECSVKVTGTYPRSS